MHNQVIESSPRKGLPWSEKWHIVDESMSRDGRDKEVSLCGAYIFPENHPRPPLRVGQIFAGTRKNRGDCKHCDRIYGQQGR